MKSVKIITLTFLLLQIVCLANEQRANNIKRIAANHASFNADGTQVR